MIQQNEQRANRTTNYLNKVLLSITAMIFSGSCAFAETPYKSTIELKTPRDISGHIAAMSGSDKKSRLAEETLWSETQSKQAELEKQLKASIKAAPENKQNYTNLAALYLSNNKSAKAIDAYQEAIMHDPKNPKLFAAISIAYLHQSKYDMAKAMADQALKLDPALQSVGKIKEYIVAKQKIVDAAAKTPVN